MKRKSVIGIVLWCLCSISTGAQNPGEDNNLFLNPCSDISVTQDLCYGKAKGYWSSMGGTGGNVGKAIGKALSMGFKQREIDLTLDLYQPNEVTGKRPLIMFIHGGAFFFGDKEENAYIDFCRHFAEMGYITASINYRMGFRFDKSEIDKATTDALSDSREALDFLLGNAEYFGIDKDRIFVAGSSSGGIIALNLAFKGDGAKPDYNIMAIANLWGAVTDLNILENEKVSIISFHGDCDTIVPYEEGYPLNLGKGAAKLFSDKLYGSASIDRKAEELGLNHHLYTFPGEGHALNKDKDEKINENQAFIKDRITEFFYNEILKTYAETLP